MDTEASSPISPDRSAALEPARGDALDVFVPRALLETPPLSSAPLVEPKTASLSKTSTSSIADAIRCEIRQMLAVEVLDLDAMLAIVNVAEKGRKLIAVRHPTVRFDAQAQGLDPGQMSGGPFITSGFPLAPNIRKRKARGWGGPMIQAANEREFARIRDALVQSPLAKAIKLELQSLTETEPFGVTELLEIEQLAGHARSILASALGLTSDCDPETVDPCVVYGGYGGVINGYGGYPQGFTDDETFGARVIRESGAKSSVADPEKLVAALAKAREKGLNDVAKHLETQLGIADEPKEQDS